jgi:hypothetical protein
MIFGLSHGFIQTFPHKTPFGYIGVPVRKILRLAERNPLDIGPLFVFVKKQQRHPGGILEFNGTFYYFLYGHDLSCRQPLKKGALF